MVIVYMEKDVIIGKMIVKKWIVTTKEKAMKYPDIPGYRIVLPENKVPLDFYKNGHKYLVDDGVLRKRYI